MNDSSSRSFTTLAKPADPSIAQVLRAVDAAAKMLGYEYFLAGATARDLVLVNALGLRPGRATRDIDFGLAVENWTQFWTFKESLIESGSFRANATSVQRLYYKDAYAGWELPVDLIPFGPIESEEGTIAWPPKSEVIMNVAGFDDAFRSAVRLTIEEDLVVRVASLPGLTLMKLLAWRDRHLENNKDASDLYTVIATYADAGNDNRLFDHELDLLEATEFNMELAGAQLLGRDIASICGDGCLGHIKEILDSERLVADLIMQMNQVCDRFGEHPKRTGTLLDHLRLGISDECCRTNR
jgi:predicted nucleotidyltransferase